MNHELAWFGIGTLGHLGLIYLDAVILILLVGTVLLYNALKSSQSSGSDSHCFLLAKTL